jgi:hypothetical protein
MSRTIGERVRAYRLRRGLTAGAPRPPDRTSCAPRVRTRVQAGVTDDYVDDYTALSTPIPVRVASLSASANTWSTLLSPKTGPTRPHRPQVAAAELERRCWRVARWGRWLVWSTKDRPHYRPHLRLVNPSPLGTMVCGRWLTL